MESTNDVLTMSLLALTFFTALVLVVFILAKYTYLTKKAYSASGQTPESWGNKYIYQDIACIVIGLGVGLGISSLISVLDISEDTMDLLIYGTISICSGIGLLLAHRLRMRSTEQ